MHLYSHKRALCFLVLFAVIVVIVEISIYSSSEGDYSLLDHVQAVQGQVANFEGKLDDPEYVIVGDVPGKSPAYDENWMDGYREGRRYPHI